MKLFFDTETTGKANFRAPADHPSQPRLVQLGALLTDDAGKELASLNLIIKPEGFTIPAEASAVHGITTERAMTEGVDLSAVMPIFAELCRKAHTIVAHNIEFDELVMDGEFLRAGFEDSPFAGDPQMFCTMHAMTPICKLPGNYGDYKWPRLQQAHQHAFGKEFDGAHDAMADVRACAKVYFWLQDRIKATAQTTPAAPLPAA